MSFESPIEGEIQGYDNTLKKYEVYHAAIEKISLLLHCFFLYMNLYILLFLVYCIFTVVIIITNNVIITTLY